MKPHIKHGGFQARCTPTSVLPQREDGAVSEAFLGNKGGKNAFVGPAVPAHFIQTNTVTSVLYDEQIDLVSTFSKFAAAAGGGGSTPSSSLEFSEGKQVHC